ncbi:MAG: heavy-metal-associated domain-containing protein [Desulfovibrio sp.]|nr:heavy-metal-associated domain-containing protein [Desulfovibrio sp.]
MQKKLGIEGMMCGHCAAAVEKALRGITGVTSVQVNLEAKQATVECAEDVSAEDLRKAVVTAGYSVVSCS